MTWMLETAVAGRHGAGLLSVGFVTALALLVGCGDDSDSASMELELPESGQVLTSVDDNDAVLPGLQFDVVGHSLGIKPGTQLDLFIDDEVTEASTEIDDDGAFGFDGATLPPGTHTLFARTTTGSASTDTAHSYTFRMLEITTPLDGAVLGSEADVDLATDGIQINVTVQSHGVDLEEDVMLEVDGSVAATDQPDADGVLVFGALTLADGEHTLKASVGDPAAESVEIQVTVQQACAQIRFVTPRPRTDGSPVVLGGSDCAADGEPFVATFGVATDVGNGRPAELMVDGTPVAMATVDGSSVTFDDVPLTRLGEPLEIVVRVTNGDGVACEAAMPGGVLVDCDGPDCVLVSPTPVAGVDAAGDPEFYINASVPSAGGYTLEVATDSELPVSLIIDGDRDNKLTVEPQGSGSERKAVFSGVNLAEGARRVQAECLDVAGNLTSTGRIEWTVDTVACTPAITDPLVDATYVPQDDTDAVAAGTQVVTSSTLSASDCSGRRAGVCDPSLGLGGDFVTFDGTSPLLTTLTLDAAEGAQTLCVETQDRAGNLGRGSVAIEYVTTPPVVAISSPADDTRFNKLGNDVAGIQVADKNPATAECELDVVVDCSLVGSPVELYRDDATPVKLAQAECVADSGAPNGGRVTFADVAPFVGTSVELYAVQAVAGAVGKLETTSSSITLEGLCEVPAVAFVACPADPIQEPAQASGLQVSFTGASAAVPQPGTLVTTDASNTIIATVGPVVYGAGSSASHYEFNNVSLLPAGALPQEVTATVTVHDQFDNAATASCTSTVEYALVPPPTLSITSPTDGTRYNKTGVGTLNSYVADGNGATPACEIDVSIACSVPGTPVDLWRDPALPFKLATANCTGTGSNGTAGFVLVAPFVTTSVGLFATQTIPGPGGVGTVTGQSTVVTVQGKCDAPGVAFDPCPAATLTEPALVSGIQVSYTGPTPAPSAFLITEDSLGDAIDMAGPVTFGTGSSLTHYEFNSVSFMPAVTLPDDVIATVTVTDAFENIGSDSCTSTVQYAPVTPPTVAITSPADDSYYNRAGAGTLHTYIADKNAATPACEVDLAVDCSLVGTIVELFRDPSNPVKITDAPCTGTPGAGTASFSGVSPFGSSPTAVVFARQTATGPGGSASGDSPAITLHGLCEPPVLTFSPCPGSPLQAPALLSGIQVTYTGPEAPAPALLVTTGGSATLIDMVGPQAYGATSYQFDNVSFLPTTGTLPQDVTATVTVEDSFENPASDTCVSTVEYAPAVTPTVAISSPADGSYFNALGAGSLHAYIADSNGGTPACDLDLVVDCSLTGAMVELFRDPVTPSKLGEALCTTDLAAPTGGRATFTDLAPFDAGATMVGLFATQTATGPAGDAVGTSATITLHGLCDPPVLAFDACPASFLVAPATVDDLRVSYAGPEAPPAATLTTTESGGGVIDMVGPVTFGAVTANRYEFDGVDFTPTPTPDDVTATASVMDSFENTATASCTSLVDVDAPTVSIAAGTPTEGASFGPNAAGTCASGVAGRMGVSFSVTVDRAADRALSIEVDDVDLTGSVGINGTPTALPATPPATTFTVCVPVPDGTHKVDVELASTRSSAVATPATRNLTLQSVAITTPATTGPFLSETCNSTADFELGVNVLFDQAHAGASFTLDTASPSAPVPGAGMVPAGGGAVLDSCVPFANGFNDLLVLIGGIELARLDDVVAVALPPSNTTAIDITGVTFGTGLTRRTAPTTLTWTASEDYPGQLVSYTLKCAPSVTPLSAASDAEDWWSNTAVEWDLAGASNPLEDLSGTTRYDLVMGLAGPRLGEPMDCALRATDLKGQLTPLPASGDLVHFRFLEQVIATSSPTDMKSMGTNAVPVGDVNGDGADDVLIGGRSRAYLYFGSADGTTHGVPDVLFVHSSVDDDYGAFGQQLAALGDVNGDGRSDFAIGYYLASNDLGTGPAGDDLAYAGLVALYYGRASDDPWPATVDLRSSNSASGTSCQADVCFEGSNEFMACGYAIGSAGHFNADANADFVVTCPLHNGIAGTAFVLLGTAFEGSAVRGGDFYGVPVGLPGSDPWGFQLDGEAAEDQLGQQVAPFGDIDANAGDDFGIIASGNIAPSRLFLASGRDPLGSSGLEPFTLAPADVLETGAGGVFPADIVALGNVRDTMQSGVGDVMMREVLGDTFYVYVGDANMTSSEPYAQADRVAVTGPTGSSLGVSVSLGYQGAGADPLPDLDGDGYVDILAGTGSTGAPYASTARLFYADLLEQNIVSGSVLNDDFATQAISQDITPASLVHAFNSGLVTRYIGDVTGDGQVDLLVGAPGTYANTGAAVILY